MARPHVRFCYVSSTQQTGANDESQKPYKFLLDDTFAFSKWNSSIWNVDENKECYQRLVNNETDIFSTLYPYPILSDIVKYFTLIKDSRYVILSSYTPVNQTNAQKESTDSLSAFTCFSNPVIAAVILTLLVFYLLFLMHYAKQKFYKVKVRLFKDAEYFATLKVRQKVTCNSDPGKILLGMLVKQSSACARINRKKKISFKLVLLMLILLLAYLHFLFVTFEKTELVVLEKPFILTSYQEIIDHKTTMPQWISYELGHTSFKASSRGSVKHQLWLMGRKQCPRSVSGCLAHLDAQNAIDYLNRIVSQKLTLIASEFSAAVVHAAMCPLANALSLNPVIMRTDNQEEPYSQALGYHKFMEASMPDVVKYITTRGKRTMESGIILELMIPRKSPMSSMASPADVRKCLYPENEDHETHVILSKSWDDYRKISSICIVFVLIAFAAQLVDHARHRLRHLRRGDQ